MGKARKIYEDRAGNTLWVRHIKTRGTMQFSAKNREGRLVDPSSLKYMIQKAKRVGRL